MEFGKESWKTFEQGIEKEWLLTNGIGGFASSTIIGANTRRYHGLLFASLKPPVARHLILSKIDESISINNTAYKLYSYKTPDQIQKGYHHLQRVTVEHIPAFIYNIGEVFIEKKICMVYGENTVAVVYRIINGSGAASLRLAPLVNFRDYHHNSSRDYLQFNQEENGREVILKPRSYDLDIKLLCSEGAFTKEENCYFINMDYPHERERGLQSVEDHFIPGYFEIDILPGEEKLVTFIATTEKEIKNTDGNVIIREEMKRIGEVVDKAGYEDEFARMLVAAADDFIVYRKSTGGKTVIAGYPWFTDWGRDTMISLPGLTLTTRRYQDAKDILYTFSRYVKDGLVPNVFPDEGQEPAYNSVDASLWYFEAVGKYIEYTGDHQFVREVLFKVLKEIIQAFVKGTGFGIRMDEDYLITAGEYGSQLTWMDAKVGDWTVTPRDGKPVEINALWYNSLRIMGNLCREYGEGDTFYHDTAEKVRESFIRTFWNEDGKYLYDVARDGYKDGSVRPNQIFAVSLSNPVVQGEMAKRVVERVWRELYTAYGLRSLSPDSKEYAGIYAGDQYKRDGAYHQGTVWGWLLGPFITAYMKSNDYSQECRKRAADMIKPVADHLMKDACIGTISEIFDGNEPLLPRGCFAQAWSVSEVLRAYVEDVMVF